MNIKEYYLLVLFICEKVNKLEITTINVLFVCEKVDKLELTTVDVLFILVAILVDVIVCCEFISNCIRLRWGVWKEACLDWS